MDFLEKIRVAGLAIVNPLLDRKVNTAEGYAVLIRDLQRGMTELAGAVAQAVGSRTRLQDNIREMERQHGQLESRAAMMLTDTDLSNDGSAITLQEQAIDLEDEIDALKAQLAEASQVEAELKDAAAKLQSRHYAMVSELNQLRALETATHAKTVAARGLNVARGALGATDVDNIKEAIRTRAAVASAQLEQASGMMDAAAGGQVADDVRRARAIARLKERNLHIAGLAEQQVDTEAGATV